MSEEPGHPAVLDRLDGDTAVLLVGETPLPIPARLLPPGTKEGAHLTLRLTPAPAAESAARDRIRKSQQDLDRTGPAGDDIRL